ncbi:MAG TPA: hypothetical protein VFR78_07270 [Pyrinomonadaceae bacterium]|nr:hypothetical protein [Pyrinomonadaceae bacterium]
MKGKSFQLEQTVPGSFFFQGLAGGILSGYVFSATLALLVQDDPQANWMIPFTPIYMVMGAIVGVVKAAAMWGAYRITGLQIRVAARVAATTILVGGVSGFIYYKAGVIDDVLFAKGVTVTWLTALPVALLVGSRVKPWEFFTFGSIKASSGDRIGSKSVLASFGTLPLRFLSIYALGVWILVFICKDEFHTSMVDVRLLFAVPFVYLLVSTYVSFRSPRKLVLLVMGILMNIPAVYVFDISQEISFRDEWWSEYIPDVTTMAGMFVIAWVLFLVSRMCVGLRTRTAPAQRPAVVFYPHTESDHHCLGSRFSEWHERVA